ncbi:MAG: universal stress protein, partial [Holophagales bacterium]|nr:universal stress protein [Holophagales bacterium]
MFSTILAAVDGSTHGDAVAEKAGSLAGICHAKLIIAYVANPAIVNDDFEKLAVTEHLTDAAGGAPHPNIAGVPGWFDDMRSD